MLGKHSANVFQNDHRFCMKLLHWSLQDIIYDTEVSELNKAHIYIKCTCQSSGAGRPFYHEASNFACKEFRGQHQISTIS